MYILIEFTLCCKIFIAELVFDLFNIRLWLFMEHVIHQQFTMHAFILQNEQYMQYRRYIVTGHFLFTRNLPFTLYFKVIYTYTQRNDTYRLVGMYIT